MKAKSMFLRRHHSQSRRFKHCSLICILPLLISGGSLPLQAETLTWNGGSGTWDANLTANWLHGAASVVWPDSGLNNDALFSQSDDAITIDPSGVAANELWFTAANCSLSGTAVLTMNGVTPTVAVGAGITATFGGGTALVLSGTAGLTKIGAGTLTLSGSEACSLTGGVAVREGTLGISLNHLATPTDLLTSDNSLLLAGGTLSGFCKGGAYQSQQSFDHTDLLSGSSSVTVNNNGGTSMTIGLGTVAQTEVGGVLNTMATNGGVFAPNTTTQMVTVANPVNAYIGPWVIAGDSKGTSARWAYVNAANQLEAKTGTAAGTNLVSMTSSTTVYTMAGTHTLAAPDKVAFCVQDNDAGSASTTLGNVNLVTNGLSQIRGAGYTRSFLQGTGSGKIVVGDANELVAMGIGNLSVAVPISNGTAGNSHLTYAGGGTLLLKAANTYSGQTTVNSGTLQLDATGSVNASNGIRINGGRLLQTNLTTPVTPPVSLMNGTVDGTGTINTLTVADSATNKLANGNGSTAVLTVGSLAFGGDATIDLRTSGTAGLMVTNTLATTPANGTVVLNVVAGPVWQTGTTYPLIGYGSWSGQLADFTLGTLPGLGARQTAALGSIGATNGFITLTIGGDSLVWTGGINANWTENTLGAPYNWKLQNAGTGTDFIASDTVVFDDSATGPSIIEIADGDVSPNSILVNASKNYTFASFGGYGIATGSLTKAGSGALTLTSLNTYPGATDIQGGLLVVGGGDALANAGMVTFPAAALATFQVAQSESMGVLKGGGDGTTVRIDGEQILTLTSGAETYAGAVEGAGKLVNAGARQTVNGLVSITGGVEVTAGYLTLGASNSYPGETVVGVGGGVVVTSDHALGAAGAGNGTILNGTGATTVTTASAALGLARNVNYTAPEKIVGAGVGNTVGNGVFAAVQRGMVQSVAGNNTFAGDIEINSAGISRIGCQNGAQLNLTGKISLASGVTGVQILFRAGENDGDYVTLSNSGNTWDLDTLIYTGGVVGNAGVRLGADNALPTTVSVAGALSSQPATTLDLAGFKQTVSGLISSSQLKIINSNAARPSTLTLNSVVDRGTNTTLLLDGAGVLSLVKQGTYSQTLSAPNNYSGVTQVEAGTLLFGNPAALYNGDPTRWTAANLSVSAGATLALRVGGAADFTVSAVQSVIANLTGGITNNGLQGGANIGLEVSAPTLYSNVIPDSTGVGGGAIGLIKTGVSTLTLDQANGYSGGTQLNNGYLTAAHSNAFGSGSVTLGAGAERVNLANGVQVNNPIIINGSNAGASNGAIQNLGTTAGEIVTLSGPITVNALPGSGGHFASKNGGILNLAGPIQSASAVVSVRDGAVTFSGGGSYSAMQVTGTAKLAADNGLATNATVDLGSAGAVGTLDLAGFHQSVVGVTKLTANGAVIGNSSTMSDATLTLTGGGTFAGVIQDAVAGGSRKVNLVLNAPSQTFVLTGANSFTGETSIEAGTLSVASPNLGDSSSVRLAATGAVLRLEFNETAGDVSDSVMKLFIGDTQMAAGVYGASGSGAANIDDTHFAGAGTLTVTQGPSVAGFDSWIGDNYPLLSDKTPSGDPDLDGIENVLEYVLAGDPSRADLAILPDPAVSASHYLFTFTRRESSALDTTQVFQYGSALSGWTDVNVTAPTGPEVTLGTPTGDLQSVTISIPKSAAVAGKLFGRLKVSK